jgi:hypothetical protein
LAGQVRREALEQEVVEVLVFALAKYLPHVCVFEAAECSDLEFKKMVL